MNKKTQRLNLKNIGKNSQIHKSSNIKCKILKIGDNVTIEKGVSLTGEKITIEDEVVIKSDTKITSKVIKIGKKTKVDSGCKIYALEKFMVGNRSDLCQCDIKGRNIKIGNDFFSSVTENELLSIGGGSAFHPQSNLIIGDRCTIHDVYLNIAMPIIIGNDVGISHGCKFYTHFFWNSIFEGYPQKFEGITILDNVIIGANSMFLPGIKLGKGCIVGASAVVTKDAPDFSIIGGNPAKIIKTKYLKKISKKEINNLMKNSLEWYIQVLKTKGFTIKKINNFDYRVSKKLDSDTHIVYEGNNNCNKDYQKAIVLCFGDMVISKKFTKIDLKNRKLSGKENELTDDLRDFLRKLGVRVFTDRRFRTIKPIK
jgi:acetyltransferase-like isoleucine patch superfamily enzyme